jgi:ABC-type nitrate/sulfonate/bicarbonate transport system substrate-binding protein
MFRIIRQGVTILAIAGAASSASAETVMAQTHLDVVAFEGSTNLPLWIGMDRGFFAKENLSVTLSTTKGAIPQMQDTMAGKYQIASTAMDNLAGFAEGQSGVEPPPGFDVVALAGVHSGSNYVIARPEIKGFADIRSKTVSVDALQSGYGFVLYRVLEDNGLKLNADYRVIAVGSGPGRLDSMKAGTSVAAVLSAPNNLAAKKLGFNNLGDTVDAISAYQATTYAARRSWASSHPQETKAFLRAMIAAGDFVFAQRAASIDSLRAHIKSLSEEEAEAVYDSLVSGKGGFNRKLAMNMAGVKMVLDLRSRYAEPKMTLTDPNKYIDLHHYAEVMKDLK